MKGRWTASETKCCARQMIHVEIARGDVRLTIQNVFVRKFPRKTDISALKALLEPAKVRERV